jgi:uncharacterized phage protein (TIGR02220 family)
MGNGKGTYYFSHDYHARNDEKVEVLRLEHGWEGYGVYWMLVERMYEAPTCTIQHDRIEQIALASSIHPEKLTSIIQTCIVAGLFQSDGDTFWSESARSRKSLFETLREQYSRGGKKGMAVRWQEKRETPPPGKNKEIKGKQREENELVKKVFDYFCAQVGRSLKLDDERRGIIKRRVKQGRTWDEFRQAIDHFSQDDWDGRDEYVDIVYCLGTRNGRNNLDHWLHKAPKGEGLMGEIKRGARG